MYQEAVTEKPVNERVEEIREMDGFTPYADLPQFYIDAAISVEDHRFESHFGIDLIAIGRAALTDIKEMSFVQGGSTITQQLAKNMLFTQEKRLERKAAEVFAALELESQYTKEEIFELYANTVYFGKGCYGIYQASMVYFGKEPFGLTDYECAVLAGMPNAPSVYSLDKELALQRVKQVLESMLRNKMITREDADRIELGDEKGIPICYHKTGLNIREDYVFPFFKRGEIRKNLYICAIFTKLKKKLTNGRRKTEHQTGRKSPAQPV